MTFYLWSCNATTSQCYAINNTRTYIDYVLILNYFVINYISLWRHTATSQPQQPESYGCQKITNFYLIMIVNSGPTTFSYGISRRKLLFLKNFKANLYYMGVLKKDNFFYFRKKKIERKKKENDDNTMAFIGSILEQNRVNTQSKWTSMNCRYYPSVSKYRISEEI